MSSQRSANASVNLAMESFHDVDGGLARGADALSINIPERRECLLVHPISARESRALRKLLREAPTSPYVFISERHAPLSVAGYQRMVARAGMAAKFTFLVHSHMLRHACGFKLANDGHDTRAIQAYLGHRSIMSTVRYTALTPNRFKNFWKD
jgi:integrase